MSPVCTDSRITPIGTVSISEREGRIVSLRIGPSQEHSESRTLDRAFLQLNEYLEGRRRSFDLETEPDGTGFQKDVWRALAEIPYGTTVSYSDIAVASGHPGADRAVGNAVGRNPIPIIIPCHRVIRSDGSIGGFALGQDLKIRLLRTEGVL